ncbi:hypothetical protein [Streptomyces sp. V3I7]|uniref:hypothetical protein n=1 Tax=Streptomyces sp. V3I7 TaxID=3042278 RepID=UPI00277FF38C|nr:hypothetical protein [Streptomyces sp. V3I7]MDQ0992463.1 hypothetical protein [Streptomyces sp. V3I7]
MRVATRKTRSRGAKLAAVGLGLTTALALGFAGPAAAQQRAVVDPVVVPGNPTCDDINGFVGDIDVAPQDATGIPITSDDGTLTGTLDVDFSEEQGGALTLEDFNFSGDLVAGAVLVKGGNNANLYDYRPNGIASDQNLIAPLNMGGNQPAISQVTFCFLPSNGS